VNESWEDYCRLNIESIDLSEWVDDELVTTVNLLVVPQFKNLGVEVASPSDRS